MGSIETRTTKRYRYYFGANKWFVRQALWALTAPGVGDQHAIPAADAAYVFSDSFDNTCTFMTENSR